MSVQIHPTSIVAEGAELGQDVSIGAFCRVGANVRLGDGVRLDSHCVVDGYTTLGAGVRVFPFAVVGSEPQDKKFAGEITTLTVGDRTVIREHATLNPGTATGCGRTVVGSDCLLMVGTHIAHDCLLGNHIILANNATLAGHVEIGDYAVLGGLCAVQQFVRIGQSAMIGGMSGVENDVIPYGLVMGNRASLSGLNLVGLDRRGFSKDQIRTIQQFYKKLFEGEGVWATRLAEVTAEYVDEAAVQPILEFIASNSKRPICMHKNKNN